MPIPLALAAPAAAAGLAYFSARTSIDHDYRVLGNAFKATYVTNKNQKRDRLSYFYVLEDHALGKQADSTFLIYEGRKWSYKEAYDMSLKYGTWLKTKYGIKSKDIVAMDFTNSDVFLFLWFGLWAIGARPAFINYNLNGKALSHSILVSTARLVLIEPSIQDNFTQEVRDELSNTTLETFSPELAAEVASTVPIREPDSARSEDQAQNLAILIYTSGTTGLPKPAIVSWKKICVSGLLVSNWMSYSRPDILYTCMPLYHSSAALLAICTTLYKGATVAVGKKFSTKTFWKECRESKATVIQYVGETCRYLLSAPPQFDPVTGENIDKKNDVRMAYGNGLRPDVWNRFKERFGISTIAEFYAATEGTSGSWNYSRNDFSKGAVGRNGFFGGLLLKRTWAIVELNWETEAPWRDPNTGFCKKVHVGEQGEMLYKLDASDTASLFQGYFNNSKSTSSKILRNVFVKGDAYFRTGDLISWDAEGRSYFNDRIGDTFRWKGENVSTAEVSEMLGAHPKVQEANVYGVELPHHDGRAGCVSIVLSEEPSEALLQDLAIHAKKQLPKYAVPLFLRFQRNMQITGTNKQQKHIVRAQGVDVEKVGDDQLFWLKDGTYVKFDSRDWDELRSGRVKL